MAPTRIAPIAALLLALLVPLARTAAAETRSREALLQEYPYYPTLLRWTKGSTDFVEPEVCGACHPEQYEQWSGSMHALAFRDPVYQGELNKAVAAIGYENARNCEGCHSPGGVISGEIRGAGLAGLGPVASAGVSCDICHSVTQVTHGTTPSGGPENASLVLSSGTEGPEGALVTKLGPFPPGEECGGGFHECAESPLHLRSELCASCHQSTHYEAHSPLGTTYTEWKQSFYGQNGVQCQDCHMVELETFLRVADRLERPTRQEYRHYFNGANYLLYLLGETAATRAGDEERAASLRRQYEMALARLRASAELELIPFYRDGRLAEVAVRVHNRRAGHSLPTHLTNIRQMWLEVTVRGEAGEVLFRSGGVGGDGELEPATRLFATEGADAELRPAVDPWAVRYLVRNDTVPARGYRDVYYGLGPTREDAPVTVRAVLRYRQGSPALIRDILSAVPADIDLEAEYGLSAAPELPVIDMTQVEVKFPARR